MNTRPRQRRVATFAAAALLAAGLVLTTPSLGQTKEQGNPGNPGNQPLMQAIDQLANLMAQNPGVAGRKLDMALIHLLEDLMRMEEHRHHHHGFGNGMANVFAGGGQPAIGAGQQTGRHLAHGGKKVQRNGQQIVVVVRKGGCAGAMVGHHKHHPQQVARTGLAGGFGKGVGKIAINAGAPKIKQGIKVGCAAGANNKAKAKTVAVVNNNGARPVKVAKPVALVGMAGAAAGKGNGGRIGNKGRGGKK